MDETMLLIWKDLEEIGKENYREPIKCGCVHTNVIYNPSDKADICLDCGQILAMEGDSCEWNSYKKEDGSFQTSQQRGDAWVSDNPYDKTGTIPGFHKNSFIIRQT